MKRFIEGETREQISLLPACLDDFVGEENPVRVIEGFIDALGLSEPSLGGYRWQQVQGGQRPGQEP